MGNNTRPTISPVRVIRAGKPATVVIHGSSNGNRHTRYEFTVSESVKKHGYREENDHITGKTVRGNIWEAVETATVLLAT